MTSPRSLPRLLLVGMVLCVLPTMSLARQSLAAPNTVQLILPAKLSKMGADVFASTDINTLSLSELAGAKDMAVGDVIYIHLNIAKSGANERRRYINYPYAVSQNRPPRSDDNTISIRGVVTDRDADKLTVRYLFENLPHQKSLIAALSSQADTQAQIALDVNRRAVGHVKAVIIAGQSFSLR